MAQGWGRRCTFARAKACSRPRAASPAPLIWNVDAYERLREPSSHVVYCRLMSLRGSTHDQGHRLATHVCTHARTRRPWYMRQRTAACALCREAAAHAARHTARHAAAPPDDHVPRALAAAQRDLRPRGRAVAPHVLAQVVAAPQQLRTHARGVPRHQARACACIAARRACQKRMWRSCDRHVRLHAPPRARVPWWSQHTQGTARTPATTCQCLRRATCAGLLARACVTGAEQHRKRPAAQPSSAASTHRWAPAPGSRRAPA